MIVYIFYILQIIYYAISIYGYIFVVYVFLSYFNLGEDNIFAKIVNALCAPVYNFFLRVLPPLRIGMFDFSPLYVFSFLYLIQLVIQRLIEIIIRG